MAPPSPPSGAQSGASSPRERVPVLVTDVQALGMLGVCRSLGRAGHETHGVSSDPRALGLSSRFNRRPAVAPPYSDAGYLPWLRNFIDRNAIEVIVPTEAFLLAIRPVYDEFRSRLPLSVDQQTLYGCLSKWDVFASLERQAPESPLRRHLPPSLLLSDTSSGVGTAALERLAAPLWVKADAVHARSAATSAVRRAPTPAAAAAAATELLRSHDRVLVQGNAPAGCQVGVNLLLDGEEVLAETMMLSRHDNPHTGGTSGLRSTWWHQGIRDDAVARARHLGWRGAAMLEYKWDPTSDDFYFIEINARFWAGLHLDLLAGVDYPRLLLDRHLGLGTVECQRAPAGVTSRWTLPTDWGHMLSKSRDRTLGWRERASAPLEFLGLFLAPGVRDDLRFPGDESLYWSQWLRFGSDLVRRQR